MRHNRLEQAFHSRHTIITVPNSNKKRDHKNHQSSLGSLAGLLNEQSNLDHRSSFDPLLNFLENIILAQMQKVQSDAVGGMD